jgi:cytoskeletal protein RodZ
MKFKWQFFTVLILFIVYGLLLPFQAIAAESENKRWGIVTKKPIDHNDTLSKESEKTTDSSIKPASDPALKQELPENREPKASNKINATDDSGSSSQKVTDIKADETEPADNKQPSQKPKSDQKSAKPKKEKICTNYLDQLQDQFLKTRHYSIQGVPCQTAENAEAFLQLAEKCNSECPEGLLEKSGYTSRIMRNIQFLEKLGNDRCGDTQSVKKTAPKPTSVTPQTKKSN